MYIIDFDVLGKKLPTYTRAKRATFTFKLSLNENGEQIRGEPRCAESPRHDSARQHSHI